MFKAAKRKKLPRKDFNSRSKSEESQKRSCMHKQIDELIIPATALNITKKFTYGVLKITNYTENVKLAKNTADSEIH